MSPDRNPTKPSSALMKERVSVFVAKTAKRLAASGEGRMTEDAVTLTRRLVRERLLDEAVRRVCADTGISPREAEFVVGCDPILGTGWLVLGIRAEYRRLVGALPLWPEPGWDLVAG